MTRTVSRLRLRRLLAGLALLAALPAVCASSAPRPLPAAPALTPADLAAIRPGDVIFRRGQSLNSRAVLLADTASQYSHVGLIAWLDGAHVVIHTVPPNAPGDAGGTRAEPVASFVSPAQAQAWAIFRLRSGDHRLAARAAQAAEQLARARAPFDRAFDLSDDASLYCTELVWLAYQRAGLDLVDGELDHFSLPLRATDEVILPSTLLKSRHLHLLRASNSRGETS